MPPCKPIYPHARRTMAVFSISVTVAVANFVATDFAQAGQPMAVCRDANGNAYFTDRGCPEDTVTEGRDYVQPAQTYNGRESIDTEVLNNYERRGNSGRGWQWRQTPR